ncbi:serine/threonine-protein kinase, active site protein [Artemisia annua]|uniref:Serine/threonine-protein kinase, active site protein n=1 Tax=Artemisia annua TaxID=35608 RepID=A0A2U1MLK9_ARTAN|nr:serine/threonine-protein kinase, active site protein [Artemisia annua]
MHLQRLLALVVLLAFLGPSSALNSSLCESSCGNVTITYPFGSGKGCYYSPDFRVNCNRSLHEPTLYFGNSTIVIKNLSTSTGEMEIMGLVAHDCYDRLRNSLKNNDPYLKLITSFRISTKNRFVAIGCDTYAYIHGKMGNESERSGCISSCSRYSRITNGSCSGVGCCEIAIQEGMSSFTLSANSFNKHDNITDINPCSHAFVVNEEKFKFSSTNLLDFENVKKMPMLLDWAIGMDTCEVAKRNTSTFLCKENSECDQDYGGPGYRCRCLKGYEGNPYTNCTNIDECAHPDHGCLHHCVDIPGNYTCSCRKGYSGDGRKGGSGCTAERSLLIEIAITTSATAVLILIFVTWLYLGVKKRRLMILREKFFRQNGGTMLQQRISGNGCSHDQAKVFTAEELKRATNNYEESRIIGKGGYGTVYKGVLSDNRMVAIKKAKIADQTESQIEQFINEVVILSQINHRNVVKLIGCCLETEVPLLVYEFISNGTLSDHIHNESKSLAITWDIRLRIATETAGALSYLHSAASVPIIHRDVKPMNILLDDSYIAKVADFGASRLIPMDQLELATIVQGTIGYLDPEYMQTSQLTDKSDVYSFGVVLVELLTGKKVLSFDRPENERNLGTLFLSSLKKGRLLQVLDEQLQLNEVPNEIIQVSRLAERCLHLKGDERPTMKELALELEGILASMVQKHPWVQSTSHEEETEYLLTEPMEDYGYADNANTGSSTFDSMSNNTIELIASGR